MKFIFFNSIKILIALMQRVKTANLITVEFYSEVECGIMKDSAARSLIARLQTLACYSIKLQWLHSLLKYQQA